MVQILLVIFMSRSLQQLVRLLRFTMYLNTSSIYSAKLINNNDDKKNKTHHNSVSRDLR